jgi:hypothetical protein
LCQLHLGQGMVSGAGGIGFVSAKSEGTERISFARRPAILECSQIIDDYEPDIESEFNHKESQIENLVEFLELQSFDGKFLSNKSFYKFFYKNDLNDFINLKQEIVKEMGNIDIKEIEEILTTSIALAYFEIIIFKKFKDESELCFEKAVKALKKMVGDEEKEKIIGEKAKEWIENWVINSNE